jgi:hypothetical protein
MSQIGVRAGRSPRHACKKVSFCRGIGAALYPGRCAADSLGSGAEGLFAALLRGLFGGLLGGPFWRRSSWWSSWRRRSCWRSSCWRTSCWRRPACGGSPSPSWRPRCACWRSGWRRPCGPPLRADTLVSGVAAAAAGLVAAAGLLVDGRPGAGLGLLLGDAAFAVALGDVLCLALLLVGVSVLVSACMLAPRVVMRRSTHVSKAIARGIAGAPGSPVAWRAIRADPSDEAAVWVRCGHSASSGAVTRFRGARFAGTGGLAIDGDACEG